MNILKNMEAIFLVATALVLVHGVATAALQSAPVAAAAVVSEAPMQVVTIVGKRLSAAEKAQ
jgi:hypothetical protein